MKTPKPTLREVLESVRPGDAGLIEASAAVLGSSREGEQVPWFVRALTAVSAWIAALLFLSFIFGVKLVSSATGSIVLGILVIAAAVFIQRLNKKKLFLEQLAFALSLAGQVLLITGIRRTTGDEGSGLATILLSIVLIIFYPDRNHRFLSTLIAVGGAVYFIYAVRVSYGLQALAVVLAAGGAHLWFNESKFLSGEKEELLRPVAYGLIAGFLFLLIPSLFPADFYRPARIAANWVPATIAVTGILLLLEYRLLSFHGMEGIKFRVFLFGGTLAVAIASLRAPGIMGALLVLVLGFHRGNRILMGLAFTFLTVFMSAYYYNMNITLLEKSWALLATGAIFLLLRPLLVNAIGAEDAEAGNA